MKALREAVLVVAVATTSFSVQQSYALTYCGNPVPTRKMVLLR